MTDREKIQVEKCYGVNDMVRVDCHGCEGCADCCQGMGDTILLDPYDCWILTEHLHRTFDELLQKEAKLSVQDGLVLPHVTMEKERDCCIFLNRENRCSIHAFRPGICRLFPLGRQYEGQSLSYFVLEEACSCSSRSKVKVKKWLDMPDLKRYQEYLIQWHSIKKRLAEAAAAEEDAKLMKQLSMFVLNHFYRKPYETEDFYEEFSERIKKAEEILGYESRD